jgi:hypothetical protein
LPDAAAEVGGVKRGTALGLEDQLRRRVGAAFEGAGGERVECGLDAGEDGDAADARLALGAFEVVTAVSLFDAEQAAVAVDVLPT